MNKSLRDRSHAEEPHRNRMHRFFETHRSNPIDRPASRQSVVRRQLPSDRKRICVHLASIHLVQRQVYPLERVRRCSRQAPLGASSNKVNARALALSPACTGPVILRPRHQFARRHDELRLEADTEQLAHRVRHPWSELLPPSPLLLNELGRALELNLVQPLFARILGEVAQDQAHALKLALCVDHCELPRCVLLPKELAHPVALSNHKIQHAAERAQSAPPVELNAAAVQLGREILSEPG
mmetsp:Transcript_18671/g.59559  ORF Transcript_18671/g.59559 Transcript_18671/m.59559 type:complete len:241 (-) Transcript_18671:850-1572(-)